MSPRSLLRLTGALSIALAIGACGEADTLDAATCPTGGTTQSYGGFAKGFFLRWCDGCHAGAAEDRQGAPPGYVFDTRDQIFALRERVYARAAGDNDSMPPGPDDPSTEERAALAEWLACGAP